MRRFLVAVASCLAVVGLVPSGSVAAHPLGNFTVSHLNVLEIRADRIVDRVVVDAAEIPTAQNRASVDADGDGEASETERTTYATSECAEFAASIDAALDDRSLVFSVVSSAFSYEPGQAGLETSRLECELESEAAVDDGSTHTFEFSDNFRAGRVGWREIVARGVDVGIVDSPVATMSDTNGLRTYPEELLESPLDIRTVTLELGPDGTLVGAGDEALVDDEQSDNAADARDSLVASRPGFLGGMVDGIQDTFDEMIGERDLTLGVGLAAIGLALVLGASHALLPGHGKTVMAAYIAGRQGSARDAVLVGVTVTATHTGGVLLLGLGLTLSTALAGETVLGWLGVISGLLIAALGLALLVNAARKRETTLFGHGHSHGPGGHTHGPDGHVHHAPAAAAVAERTRARGTLVATPASHDDGAGGHHHDHGDRAGHGHGDRAGHGHGHHAGHGHGDHDLGHGDHDHGHDHHDGHAHGEHAHDDHDHSHGGHDHDGHVHGADQHVSRGGLIGMGVAGGLVPSPSALIVLLSAIALGRTWFGVILVIGYGAGMAIVLTLAGIALVRVRDRYQERLENAEGRVATSLRRWGRLAPFATAALVMVVGIGLAIRSFTAI